MVGTRDYVVVSGLLAQDLAVGFFADYQDALLVDVLAAQLFAAVLVGGYAGHDGVGGWGLLGWGVKGGDENDREQANHGLGTYG
jgi:hypothetical protein